MIKTVNINLLIFKATTMPPDNFVETDSLWLQDYISTP